MGSVLFTIGNLKFYTHGFFLVVGVICSAVVMYQLAKRDKRNTEAVFDLAVFSLLAGVIMARLTYFLIYRDQFYVWSDVLKIWQGGLVSWGGFIAGIVCYFAIVKIYKEPTAPWLDILGVSALLGISIGRFGSFLSGELAGKSTHTFLAVRGAFPVTLFESIIMLIMFVLFLTMFMRKKSAHDGRFFLLIILVYCFARFLLDFIRVDNIVWLGLTYSQIISSLIIVLLIIYLIFRLLQQRKGARYA